MGTFESLSQEEVQGLLDAMQSREANKGKDCVALDDGRLLCYDTYDSCYYIYYKKKVSSSELSPKDLTKLVAYLSDQRRTDK
jgi:phage gp16-like protein